VDRATALDLRVVASQIGRMPRGVTGVPRRCSFGFPQVVQVHPVVDGKPFPTLYWLTCPFLSRELDHLEAAGWIGRLESEVAHDSELLKELLEAREDYVSRRLAELSTVERSRLDDVGMLAALADRGIGGIAEKDRLKCLHLHVAHELSASNPIGRRALGMLGARECLADEVFCSAPSKGAEQTQQINR